ncbi:MAG: transcription initiation factor IIB family protein [Candidatus Hadarchaeales archaeon]
MRCPTCGSGSVLHDRTRGEIICTRCGLVILERLLDPGPEWRVKEHEERGRAELSGSDLTQHDLGLGTTFSVSIDAPPSVRASLRRMEKLQSRSRVSGWKDRNLRDVLVDLEKLCGILGLPKGIRAEISLAYRKINKKGMTVGRNHVVVLAALAFLICRSRGLPRTFEEIIEALNEKFGLSPAVKPRTVRKLASTISRELGLKPRPISPEDYLERFASQLNMEPGSISAARDFMSKIPEKFKKTRSPVLLAAISIYMASSSAGLGLTLSRISNVTGAGVSTISKNLSLLKGR